MGCFILTRALAQMLLRASMVPPVPVPPLQPPRLSPVQALRPLGI
jgi:hypothetical protein